MMSGKSSFRKGGGRFSSNREIICLKLILCFSTTSENSLLLRISTSHCLATSLVLFESAVALVININLESFFPIASSYTGLANTILLIEPSDEASRIRFLTRSQPRNSLSIARFNSARSRVFLESCNRTRMDHISCFLSGAMGAMTSPVRARKTFGLNSSHSIPSFCFFLFSFGPQSLLVSFDRMVTSIGLGRRSEPFVNTMSIGQAETTKTRSVSARSAIYWPASTSGGSI